MLWLARQKQPERIFHNIPLRDFSGNINQVVSGWRLEAGGYSPKGQVLAPGVWAANIKGALFVT
jgi:hypothetical protein